jgi:hypothetical protein
MVEEPFRRVIGIIIRKITEKQERHDGDVVKKLK